MRIVVAPDKLKGSLDATGFAAAIGEGLRRALPDAEIVELPVADGGEGTLAALLSSGGQPRRTVVEGPLGALVTAGWGLLDGPNGTVAVIELARASGLGLVHPSPDSAGAASTYGCGQLLNAALDAGAGEILVGAGGSASTDAAAGAAMAVGVGLHDRAGAPLRRGGLALRDLDHIDLRARDPRLAHTRVVIAHDVAHHLLGATGAARTFGPQKGADGATVHALEVALERFVEVARRDLGCDPRSVRGGGAAGGFAAGAVAMLGAELAAGIDIVLDLLDFDRLVAGADLVVTGEGSLDAQSLRGKAPVGVARRAARHGVPTVAVAGRCDVPLATLREHNIRSVITMSELAGGPATSMADPRRWAAAAGRQLASRTDRPVPG